MPSRTASPESRFIGYVVLGFGLLAVIAVLVLALGGRGSDNQDTQNDKASVQANAGDLRTDMSSRGQVAAPVPETEKDLFFKRDKKFKAERMEGDWQAAIGRYTAVLQIRKDVYQLILAKTDPAAPRLYSTGTYTVNEDIITLTPQESWPAPASPKGRIIAYDKLTRAPFPVIARFDGDTLLWQNVPQDEKRVVAPYTSPLFMSEDVKVATWKKL